MSEETYFSRRQLFRAATMSLAGGLLSKGAPRSLPIEGELPSFAGATNWLNSTGLTSHELRGKVVAVNFWTYTCINWLRFFPYVRAWAERYESQGLVTVGVHTPEFGFEKEIDNVSRAVKRNEIHYPIAVDNDYAVWRAFDNQYWPALYIVDTKGHIRHHQFGEGGYRESEFVIRQLLSETNTLNADRGFARVKPQEAEVAADWQYLQSPETYLGYEQTQGFTSRSGMSHKTQTYAVPTQLKLNHWALAGEWTIGRHSVVTNDAGGRIAYRFHARDVHLVMGATTHGSVVPVRVFLDGQPPQNVHGVDVDAEGNGRLAEPRLYQLIRQAGPIDDRQVEIEFPEGGAEAFAFTFG